jgi:hypothetical protein
MRIRPVSGGTQNRVHSMSKCRESLAAKTLGESKDSNFLALPMATTAPREQVAQCSRWLVSFGTDVTGSPAAVQQPVYQGNTGHELRGNRKISIGFTFILSGSFLDKFQSAAMYSHCDSRDDVAIERARTRGNGVAAPCVQQGAADRRTGVRANTCFGTNKEWTAGTCISTRKRCAARAGLATDGRGRGMPGVVPSNLVW